MKCFMYLLLFIPSIAVAVIYFDHEPAHEIIDPQGRRTYQFVVDEPVREKKKPRYPEYIR